MKLVMVLTNLERHLDNTVFVVRTILFRLDAATKGCINRFDQI
jgi:pyruvate dehydrogenase complex dehydrogenase (E1) component